MYTIGRKTATQNGAFDLRYTFWRIRLEVLAKNSKVYPSPPLGSSRSHLKSSLILSLLLGFTLLLAPEECPAGATNCPQMNTDPIGFNAQGQVCKAPSPGKCVRLSQQKPRFQSTFFLVNHGGDTPPGSNRNLRYAIW